MNINVQFCINCKKGSKIVTTKSVITITQKRKNPTAKNDKQKTLFEFEHHSNLSITISSKL